MRAEKGPDKAASCLQGAQKLSSPDSAHCLLYPGGLAEGPVPRTLSPSAARCPWVSPAFFTCSERSPVVATAVTTRRQGLLLFCQQRVLERPCRRMGPRAGRVHPHRNSALMACIYLRRLLYLAKGSFTV